MSCAHKFEPCVLNTIFVTQVLKAQFFNECTCEKSLVLLLHRDFPLMFGVNFDAFPGQSCK